MAGEFIMGAKMTLKDTFSNQIKDVKKATELFDKSVGKADTSTAKMASSQVKAAAEMGRLNREATNSSRALDGGAKSADKFSRGLKSLIAAAGAYFSIRAIAGAVRDWTEAAKAQIAAETRLETLMKNVPGTTEKQIKAIKLYAAELQGLTTIGDEVAIAGASQLATFQLQANSIAKLMPAMNDLAVGTYGVNVSQDNMIQTGNLVGKVLQGQVGALSRIGITFSKQQEEMLKAGTEAQKVATLMEVINQNYGGLAKTMAQTDEGKIIQFKNAWGDVKEELGKQVLPLMGTVSSFLMTTLPKAQAIGIGALQKINYFLTWLFMTAQRFGPNVIAIFRQVGVVIATIFGGLRDTVGQFLQQNGQQIDRLRTVFINAFMTLLNYAGPILTWLSKNAVPAVTSALQNVVKLVLDVANFFLNNWEPIKPFVQGLVVVLGGYLAVTNAIKLATLAWTAIQKGINAIMIVYKTVMLAGKFVTMLFTGQIWALTAAMLANPIGLVIGALVLLVGALIWAVGGWDNFKNIVVGVWNHLKAVTLPVVTLIKDSIVSAFTAVYSWVTTYWPMIQNIIGWVWAYLGPYVTAAVEIIKSVIVNGFNLILGVVKGTWLMIQGVIQVAWSIISGIIGIGLAILTGDWAAAWDAMLGMLKGVGEGIGNFFKGLGTVFFESGKAIINTLVDGIKSVAMAPVNAVKNIFGKVRNLLPFSDAKTGPFSNLTFNGGRIMTTLADGVQSQAGVLDKAVNKAFSSSPVVSVGTSFDNVTPPAISMAADVNPAGRTETNTVTKTIVIEKLIEKLELRDVGEKDPKALVKEIITLLYEELKGADDILGAEMGGLL